MSNMVTSENLSDTRPKTNGSVASAIRRFQNAIKNSSSPTKKKKIVTAFDKLTRSEEYNQDKKIRTLSTSGHSTLTRSSLESKNQSKKDEENQNLNKKRHEGQAEVRKNDKEDHKVENEQEQDQNTNGSGDEDADEDNKEDGCGDEIQTDFQETGSRDLFTDNFLFKAISRVDTNDNNIKSLQDGRITETTSLIPLLSGTITRTNSFPNYGSPNHSENNTEFHDIEMVQPCGANITINKTNGVLKQIWLISMVVIITTVLSVVAVYLYFAL